MADSQRLVAESMAVALSASSDLQVVPAHPAAGLATVDAIGILRPQVAVVDYWLGGLQGPGVVIAGRSRLKSCRIIVVGWMETSREISNAAHAGAAAFVPRTLPLRYLVEAIGRTPSAETFVYGERATELTRAFSRRHRGTAALWLGMRTLAPRELELLVLLNLGKSAAGIADELSLSRRTVENYLRKMFVKTGARSQTEMLAMARECDLIGG